MRFIEHDGRPKIEEVELNHDPMSVWLTSREEILIERGDRLFDVAKKVHQLHPEWNLGKKGYMKLVAYWFALGERFCEGTMERIKWTRQELRATGDRRYLEDSC